MSMCPNGIVFVVWYRADPLQLAETSLVVDPGQLEDQILRLLLEGAQIVDVDTEQKGVSGA